MSPPTPLAVLASGGGRTVENLVAEAEAGRVDVEVRLVLVDRAEAGVLARCERLGIQARVLPWSREAGVEAYSRQVFGAVEAAGCELVCLAGFLRLLRLPEPWRGRVLNIHPSLLPAFGGKGYYGDRVHAAVLARGVWFTGCTVHLVDDEYDNGPILVQRVVAVQPGDTVEALAARVFEEEKQALPEGLRRLLAGKRGLHDG